MPRRGYKKIKIDADSVYDSYEVAKLITYVMRDGKKSIAQDIVYTAFEAIKSQNRSPMEVLNLAIQNVSPSFEVKPRRVGGASYLVPVETRPGRKLFLSLNWIINAASSRPNKEYHTFAKKLTQELLDAASGVGAAVEKRAQVEKLAEQNKAFAHFKW